MSHWFDFSFNNTQHLDSPIISLDEANNFIGSIFSYNPTFSVTHLLLQLPPSIHRSNLLISYLETGRSDFHFIHKCLITFFHHNQDLSSTQCQWLENDEFFKCFCTAWFIRFHEFLGGLDVFDIQFDHDFLNSLTFVQNSNTITILFPLFLFRFLEFISSKIFELITSLPDSLSIINDFKLVAFLFTLTISKSRYLSQFKKFISSLKENFLETSVPFILIKNVIKMIENINFDPVDVMISFFQHLLTDILDVTMNRRLLHFAAPTADVLRVLSILVGLVTGNSESINIDLVFDGMKKFLTTRDDVFDCVLELIFDPYSELHDEFCSFSETDFSFINSVFEKLFGEELTGVEVNIDAEVVEIPIFDPFASSSSIKSNIIDSFVSIIGGVHSVALKFQHYVSQELLKRSRSSGALDTSDLIEKVEILKKYFGNELDILHLVDQMIVDVEDSVKFWINHKTAKILILSRHCWPSNVISSSDSKIEPFTKINISRIESLYKQQHHERVIKYFPLEGRVKLKIKDNCSEKTLIIETSPISLYILEELKRSQKLKPLDFSKLYQVPQEFVLNGFIELINLNIIRTVDLTSGVCVDTEFVFNHSASNAIPIKLQQQVVVESAEVKLFKKFINTMLKTSKKGLDLSGIIGMLKLYLPGKNINESDVELAITKLTENGNVMENNSKYFIKK
ncbi:hypothetical protein P9112_003340 [Eukaryota sp. TZLM1-RC]